MKKQYIKIITAISIIALLSIQGIWLFNTYHLLHQKIITELEEGFARSIEKEVYLRLDKNRTNIPNGTSVKGAHPELDSYANALYFHEYLLSWEHPLSLERVDSIWSKKLNDDIGQVNYLLLRTDSAGHTIEKINHGANEKSPYSFTIERPIRIDGSEHLRTVIDSPYKIVLREMTVLLVTSFLIVMLLGYGLFLQIQMIIRQGRIAEIRQGFTQAMVHDMRNPITNILMSAGMLKSGKLDEKIEMKEAYFDIILKDGNRLLAFSNKLLTIARFEEKKIGLKKIDMNIRELFDGLIEEYRLSTSETVRFTTEIEDGSIIHADPEYITDVFRNLIDNAIKYSKEKTEIHIRAAQHTNDTVIQIRDNGIGISPKDRKRIFNKFERSNSQDKQGKGGFGLGLFYVYLVVTAHGGSVKVESTPDVFSEFTIIIPTK